MTLGQNGDLRYGHFSDFWDNMANLGLIDCKISLYIKVNVYNYNGQNKFEVHISKNVAKMAINWHKIGKIPLWRMNIK